jgi:hypothetical protein
MDIGHATWLESVYCSKIEKKKIDDIWLTLLQAKLLHTILQTRSNWNSAFSESSQKTPIACCLKIKRSVEKKKEKVFFLFCFPRDSPFIIAPMSRSQLPSVKYVYVVDYKSMIGGYRTLLVMNSVNPLLIPLRYLNHAWVTSQQV